MTVQSQKCTVMHMPPVDGSRWRDRRTDLDLDQDTAAADLDIPKRALQNIETVQGRPVSERVIKRAARYYQCSPEWLQGLDDNPPAPPTPDPAPRREPKGEPTSPPPRREGKDNRRGPARAEWAEAS